MITKDIEVLLATPPKRNNKVCAVTFALNTFDAENRKALEIIIDRPNADIAKIGQFFIKYQLYVPIAAVRRHRWRLQNNGMGCKCPVNV